MSQYQPNAAPNKSFIERINSKFANLSVSAAAPFSEKDGSSDNDTLIHNAFVKFFDSQNQPYPEWLGAKNHRTARGSHTSDHYQPQTHASSQYQPQTLTGSQYQPVRASYNSVNSGTSFGSNDSSAPESEAEARYNSRRTNSKLQAMYNKSRQQSVGSQHSRSGSGSSKPRDSGYGSSTHRGASWGN